MVSPPQAETATADRLPESNDSLNPRQTVRTATSWLIRLLPGIPRDHADAEVTELPELVRLSPDLADRYSGELSEGRGQRDGIARAIAVMTDLLARPTSRYTQQLVTAASQLVGRSQTRDLPWSTTHESDAGGAL